MAITVKVGKRYLYPTHLAGKQPTRYTEGLCCAKDKNYIYFVEKDSEFEWRIPVEEEKMPNYFIPVSKTKNKKGFNGKIKGR